ncbi:TetR/AcrR family transcriptional regulator [Nocardia mexicana]|uniref:TetR/AcrR family transcriptional regulator n=1 Tax=Nocardia mexicana TaxID=279262 RepID=UPI000832448C|nr:TetR/AcrR family transcriptional regulator [Nocardia mexicana]
MTTAERQYGGRAVTERKAERRQRFVDAAIRIFAERGYANCSLADVCTAAGLSKRQFYEIFQTREDVLVAAYDHIHDEAGEAITQALATVPPGTTIEDVIEVVLTAFLDSVGSDHHRAKVAFIEVVGVSDRMEEHRRERRGTWTRTLETIVSSVAGPGARIAGGTTWGASALIGAINAMAHEWLLSDPRPPISDLMQALGPVAAALVVTE